MGKSLSDMDNPIPSAARPKYLKELIAEARIQLDKLDDAFEGMIDDDTFIDGWFGVRKIKGRDKPNVKDQKGPDENN